MKNCLKSHLAASMNNREHDSQETRKRETQYKGYRSETLDTMVIKECVRRCAQCSVPSVTIDRRCKVSVVEKITEEDKILFTMAVQLSF